MSTATVSRVLSGTAKVSPAKQAQVMQAIKKLDYNPSDLTRAIFTGRSNSVGLLVADLRNPYYVDLMRGVESVVTEHGGLVFLASAARDPDREASVLRAMDAQRMRGLVITSGHDPIDHAALGRLADHGTQVVFVTRPVALPHPRVHSVRVDDEAVGALAWQHLRDRGRSNVAVVTQSAWSLTQRERSRGIRTAARIDHVDIPEEHITELSSLEEPADGLRAVIEAGRDAGRPIDAVFATSGIATLRAYQELADMGISIPDDVAFVGFDDFPWAAHLKTPLTVVTQPALEIATQAAQLIIDEPEASVTRMLAPGLTVRAST